MTYPDATTIREARTSAGMTQMQAAALIWHSIRTWQLWESGQRKMHPAIWLAWQARLAQRAA